MEPLLRDGDLLTLCAVSHGELRRGDIVALRLSDKFPTCRVARLLGDDAVVLSADNWPDFHATAAESGRPGSNRRAGTGHSCLAVWWLSRLHAHEVTPA